MLQCLFTQKSLRDGNKKACAAINSQQGRRPRGATAVPRRSAGSSPATRLGRWRPAAGPTPTPSTTPRPQPGPQPGRSGAPRPPPRRWLFLGAETRGRGRAVSHGLSARKASRAPRRGGQPARGTTASGSRGGPPAQSSGGPGTPSRPPQPRANITDERKQTRTPHAPHRVGVAARHEKAGGRVEAQAQGPGVGRQQREQAGERRPLLRGVKKDSKPYPQLGQAWRRHQGTKMDVICLLVCSQAHYAPCKEPSPA